MLYNFASNVSNLYSFLQEVRWTTDTNIIGHSMGAGISLIFAGCFPTLVRKLIMIDGFGPITAESNRASALLSKAIEQENAFYKNNTKGKKIYENINKAIENRIRSVSTYPGNQSISREAATTLVSRGTQLLDNNDNNEDIDENNPNNVVFRHDPRLFLPSYSYFSNDQILNFVESITAKTLLIQGSQGWPVGSQDVIKRKQIMESKNILEHVILPGSHHLHLDPSSREKVGDTILDFLIK